MVLSRWRGPYRITTKVGPLNFEVVLEDSGEDLRIHAQGTIPLSPNTFPRIVNDKDLKVLCDLLDLEKIKKTGEKEFDSLHITLIKFPCTGQKGEA